ncbi:MAG: site-2 protease family protein [Candidatus Neomarinimicrobiota bacterium]
MTETDIKKILKKLQSIFITRKIGNNGEKWLIAGELKKGSISSLTEILEEEPIIFNIKNENEKVYISLEAEEKKVILKIPKISRLHLSLFLATIFTTLFAGTIMAGGQPLVNPADIIMGIPFSLTLMLILGTHEFGHYYYAQKHNVEATLPYFIPAPPFIFLIGTFGAFIKIKSPIYRKDALLQIGAAGPIAGFLVAIPALFLGLSLSTVVEQSNTVDAMLLGDSLIMKTMTMLLFPHLGASQDIMLHPIAFAGWIGLLVTMLNLLPIGQLDGGHIAFAMLGNKQHYLGRITLFALIPLSYFSLNWLVWGILILVLMRTAKHPPIQDIQAPLSKKNKFVGFACLIIFILSFIPAPFRF